MRTSPAIREGRGNHTIAPTLIERTTLLVFLGTSLTCNLFASSAEVMKNEEETVGGVSMKFLMLNQGVFIGQVMRASH